LSSFVPVSGWAASPIHVRNTPDSDRTFKARLFVAMCHKPTLRFVIDYFVSTQQK